MSGAHISMLLQVRLIAWLRWRLLANSLREKRQRLELAAKILLGIFFALFVIGTALGMLGLGFASTRDAKAAALLPAFCWGLFFVWHLMPLLMAPFRAEFEFRLLLRYPLNYAAFFSLNLLYGLFDVWALLGAAGLAGLAAGMSLGRPAVAGVAVVAAALFALVNLLLNRVIYAWLERVLATRRGREAALLVFVLATLSLQLLGPLAERSGGRLKTWLLMLAPALDLLPPSAAADALRGSLAGSFATPLALLAAWAAGLGWLLHARTRAEYLGESGEESAAPQKEKVAPVARVFRPGVIARLVRDPLAALVERELRYLLRTGLLLLNLFLPLVFLVLFSLGRSSRPEGRIIFGIPAELNYATWLCYSVVVVAGNAVNSFGMERAGVQFYYLAPVNFRTVLLAKNIYVALLGAFEAVLLLAATLLLAGPPGPAVLLSAWLAAAFLLLVICGMGNITSVLHPRAVELGKFATRLPWLSVLLNMLAQFIMLGVVVAAFIAGRRSGSYWTSALALAAVVAACLPAYFYALGRAARLAETRGETLLDELCRASASSR